MISLWVLVDREHHPLAVKIQGVALATEIRALKITGADGNTIALDVANTNFDEFNRIELVVGAGFAAAAIVVNGIEVADNLNFAAGGTGSGLSFSSRATAGDNRVSYLADISAVAGYSVDMVATVATDGSFTATGIDTAFLNVGDSLDVTASTTDAAGITTSFDLSLNIVTAIALIAAYADGDGITPPALTLQNYDEAGITGVTAANVDAVNARVLATATGAADTLAEVQALVSHIVIEAYANDHSQPMPSVDDYANIGVIGVTANNLDAVNAAANDSADVDTVTKVQALVNAVAVAAAVIEAYADGASLVPWVDAYASLGVTGVTANNLAAVNAAVAAAPGNSADVDTVAKIQALVSPIVIEAYANDNSQPAPSVNDYATIGVIGVTSANLNAINFRVASATGEVDTLAEIQAVVSYFVIRLYATSGGEPAPSLDDYQSIGVSGVTAANLATVNAAVAAVPSKSDTVAKIQVLVSHIVIEAYADDATSPAPSLEDYQSIGVSGVTAANLATVNAAIAAVPGNSLEVDTVQKIQDVVIFARVAIDVIEAYANDNSNTAPSLAAYAAIGVTGVTAANLDAVNAAVDSAANGSADVDTAAKVQALVDAAVLSTAAIEAYADDNTNPAPSLAAYAAIGVSGVTADNLDAVNAAVAAAPNNSADVDTVTEVQALVDAAVASSTVIQNYANATTNLAPTLEDYQNIAVTGVSADNLDAVNAAVAVAADNSAAVDTVAEVQALVAAVVLSSAIIEAYADDNSQPEPSVDDYANIGVVGVTAGNLDALNAVVSAAANGSADVDTVSEVQALVHAAAAAINFIEAYAAGGIIAPWVDAYASIGVSGVTADNLAAVNAAVAAANDSAAVDTVAEIQALVSLIVIAAYADDNSKPAPSLADYAAIGVSDVSAGNLDAVNAAVATVPGNSAAVDTPAKIQALVAAAVLSSAVIEAYADDNSNTAPSLADYANIGVSGVSAANLAVVNAAVHAAANGSNDVDTVAEVQALVDATMSASAVIEAYADDNSQPAPNLEDYVSIGVIGVTAANLVAVNAAVDAVSSADVDTPAKVQALVSPIVIKAYADDATQPAPSVEDYAAIGVTGVTTGNLAAVNAVVDAAVGGSGAVDTVAEVQALVDTVVTLTLLAVNGRAASGEADIAASENVSITGQTTAVAAGHEVRLVFTNPAGVVAEYESGMSIADAGFSNASSRATVDLFDQVVNGNTQQVIRINDDTNRGIARIDAVLDAAAVNNIFTVGARVSANIKLDSANGANGLFIGLQVGAGDLPQGSGFSGNNRYGFYVLKSPSNGLRIRSEDGTTFDYHASTNFDDFNRIELVVGAGFADAAILVNGIEVANNLRFAAGGSGSGLVFSSGSSSGTNRVSYLSDISVIVGNPADVVATVEADGSFTATGIDTSLLNLGDSLAVTASTTDTGGTTTSFELSLNIVTAIAIIAAYANGDGIAPPALTLQNYLDAGITSVTAANVNAVNAHLLASATGEAGTLAELQAVVSGFVIEAYANDSSQPAPSVDDYAAIGVTGVSAANLAAVNAAVAAANGSDDVDTAAEVQALVNAAVVSSAIIEAYADDSSLPAPSVEDYANIGVSGVTASNLAAVNAVVAATPGNSADVDTPAKVQALVPFIVIKAYADDNSQATPNLEDYLSIGVSGVSAANLAAVNAAVAAVGSAAVDTLAEVQALVSQAVIEAYADDSSQPAPTVEDYAAIGVTGVTTGNLAAVNAVLDAAVGGSAAVDTLAEVQALVDTVVTLTLSQVNGRAASGDTGDIAASESVSITGQTTGLEQGHEVRLAFTNPAAVVIAEYEAGNTLAQAGFTAASTGSATVDLVEQELNGNTQQVIRLNDDTTTGLASVEAALSATEVNTIYTEGARVSANIKLDSSNGAKGLYLAVRINNADAPIDAGFTGTRNHTYLVIIRKSAGSDKLYITSTAGSNGHIGVNVDNTVFDEFNRIELVIGAGFADTAILVNGIEVADDLSFTFDARTDDSALVFNSGSTTETNRVSYISDISVIAGKPDDVVATVEADGSFTATGIDTSFLNDGDSLAVTASTTDAAGTTASFELNLNIVPAIAIIAAYADGDGITPPALTLQNYLDAGITGVTATNVDAVNARVLASASGAADTVAEVQAVASQVVIEVYANDNNQPAPSLADYAAIGVSDVSATNLAAVNAAVAAANSSADVDTVAEVQNLVNAVLESSAVIEAYADATTNPAPSLEDYANIGVTGVSASNLAAVNAVVAATPGNSADVDTPAKVQALVQLLVIKAYVDDATGPAPSLDDYAALGVTGVSADNLDAVNAAVATAPNGSADVDTVVELKALVAAAVAATAVIEAYANDHSQPAPSVDDYAAIGVSGVSAAKLAAVNAAVAAAPNGSEAVDTLAKVQALVAVVVAASAVIEAYAADHSQPAPNLENYQNIGVTGLSTANLAAVNTAVAAVGSADVDTLAKVQALVSQVLIEAYADDSSQPAPRVDDYAAIGVTGVSAGNLAAVNTVLEAAAGGSEAVDTLAEVQALVDTVVTLTLLAVNGRAASGETSDIAASESVSITGQTTGLEQGHEVRLALTNPAAGIIAEYEPGDTLADTGFTDATSSPGAGSAYAHVQTTEQAIVLFDNASDGIARINAALSDTDINNIFTVGVTVSANIRLHDIIGENGLFIGLQIDANDLPEGSGLSGNHRYGFNVFKSPSANTLRITGADGNDIAVDVDNTVDTNVNRIELVVGAGFAAAAILVNGIEVANNLRFAAGGSGSVLTFSSGSTGGTDRVSYLSHISAVAGKPADVVATVEADGSFTATGIDTSLLNDGDSLEVRASTTDAAGTTTHFELNLNIVPAIAIITAYANGDGITPPALTLQNYDEAGITSVTAANVNAVNAHLLAGAIGAAGTLAELQAVVSGFVIEAYANDSSQPAPSVDDYAAIGVTGVSAANLAAVNAAVAAANGSADVDTLAEVQALVNAAVLSTAIIEAYADDNTKPAPSVEDYANIGVSGVTATNLEAVNAVVAAAPGNSAAVDTPAKVQALVPLIVITAYADDNSQPAPSVADYAAIAVIGVSAANLAAVNAAVAAVGSAAVDTLAKVQALVSQVLIEAYADDSSQPAPTVEDYAAIGVTGVSPGNLAAVNAVLEAATGSEAVDTLAEVQALVDTVVTLTLLAVNARAASGDTGDIAASANVSITGQTTGLEEGHEVRLAFNNPAAEVLVEYETGDTLAQAGFTAVTGRSATVDLVEQELDGNTQQVIRINGNANGSVAVEAALNLVEIDNIYTAGARVSTNIKLGSNNTEGLYLALVINHADAPIDAGLTGVGSKGYAVVIRKSIGSDNLHITGINGNDHISVSVANTVFDEFNRIELVMGAGFADAAILVNGIEVVDDLSFDLYGNSEESAFEIGARSRSATSKLNYISDISVIAGSPADVVATVEADGSFTATGIDTSFLDVGDSLEVTASTTDAAGTTASFELNLNIVPAIAIIAAYADGDGITPPALTLQNYLDANITGVTATNVDAVNARVLASATGAAGTVAEVQALASQLVIEVYANDNSQPAPSLEDYANIGVTDVTATNLAAINAAVATAANGSADVDTLAKIQNLVAAALASSAIIEAYADDATTNPAPSLDDYANIGVTGVTAANLAAVNAVVAATPGNSADVDTPAKVQALVPLTVITAYADDNNQATPSVDDYAAIAVIGVSAANLAAVNAAVAAVGSADVDTLAEVQALVSQAVIEAYADDSSQPAPSVDDYAAIGVTGVSADNLAVVNAAVDAAANDRAAVDTPAQVQALVFQTVVPTLTLSAVNGRAASGETSDIAASANVSISGQTTAVEAGQEVRLALISPADFLVEYDPGDTLADAGFIVASTGSATVDLVEQELNGNTQQVIRLNDDTEDGLASVEAALSATEVNTIYTEGARVSANIKLDSANGDDGLLISLQIVAADLPADSGFSINALAYAINVTRSDNSDTLRIQDRFGYVDADVDNTVFDEFNRIELVIGAGFADAAILVNGIEIANNLGFFGDGSATGLVFNSGSTDGTNGVSYISDISLIAGKPEEVVATVEADGSFTATGIDTSFLNAGDSLDVRATIDAAGTTASFELNLNIVTAIAIIAAYADGDGITPPALTLQNYLDANITGVTAANVNAVNARVLASASGEAGTLAAIQALASQVVIEVYANDNSQPAPSLDDYQNIAVTGAAADNLDAVNAAVAAANGSDVDTVAEVQNLVNAALASSAIIEAYADDATTNTAPSLENYANIGVAGVTASNLVAVNAAVAAAPGNSAAVDTLAKVQALVSQAVIEAYADDNTQPAPSIDDYAVIGVIGITAANLAAVNTAVAAVSSAAVATLAKVQALVSQEVIKAYADNNSQPAPSVEDYAAIAVIGITAHNLAAVNTAVAAVSSTDVDTLAKVQALVSQAVIEAYADDSNQPAPSVEDYAAIGVTGVSANKLETVNAAVATAANNSADVDTVQKVQNLVNAAATATAVLEAYANDATTNPAPGLETYANIGVTGVSANNLEAINAVVAAAANGGADVATLAKVQALVSQVVIEAYADDNSQPAPSVDDYANIGVIDVTAGNLHAVNAAVDAVASIDVNTVAKIQLVVDTPVFNNTVSELYVTENVATFSAVYDAQAAAYQGRDANDTDITYTLSGTDAGAFTINPATGELRFVAAPDFEAAADADADNSYDVIITASHTVTGQSADQALSIKVLDQNLHGTQLTAYTRTTADATPVLEGTGPAGATILVAFAGARYNVLANRFGSWRIDTETATPTSGSLAVDTTDGSWNAIALSAFVEGETLTSVAGITFADVSATDASAFHLQTYADGSTSANGAANDIDYEAYNGDEPSTQNAILIGKSELEYISNAALIALGEAGIGELTWQQVASLSPEQLSALHDENLLDNFNFGSDKPSMILNAITGTDIISEQEMAEGFTVKIDGSGFANATVKLLLDNDRGSWHTPADEATALAHYTLIGEGTADASGHLDFIFTNGADDRDNTNTTIGTEVLSGGSLTKKFTVWNDLNDDGIIDIDTGETAERVFYTADGTASMEDAIANPGINYSILDPITEQAFVYFYGDIDHGPQNGVGTDDMDGFWSFSNTGSADDDNSTKGISGNFAADLYEFHANSLASEGRANWQTSQDRANDQDLGGVLATSATARALSFEQLGALIAANFGDDNALGAAGSNPNVLDYIRDRQGSDGNYNIADDISLGAGWTNSWNAYTAQSYWSGTAFPLGHGQVLFRAEVADLSDSDRSSVASVASVL